MKFKIDENLPCEIAVDLRGAGHEADTVTEQGLTGAADSVVLARVQSEGRTILTLDKGIADVRLYPPDQFAGIILFRPRTTGRQATLDFVRQHLPIVLQDTPQGHLFVVTEGGIRKR